MHQKITNKKRGRITSPNIARKNLITTIRNSKEATNRGSKEATNRDRKEGTNRKSNTDRSNLQIRLKSLNMSKNNNKGNQRKDTLKNLRRRKDDANSNRSKGKK